MITKAAAASLPGFTGSTVDSFTVSVLAEGLLDALARAVHRQACPQPTFIVAAGSLLLSIRTQALTAPTVPAIIAAHPLDSAKSSLPRLTKVSHLAEAGLVSSWLPWLKPSVAKILCSGSGREAQTIEGCTRTAFVLNPFSAT